MGPVIVAAGTTAVSPDTENFFGTGISDVHPRITAGVTAHGALLLLVIDGRQDASRGVSLDELAKILWALAAAEAVNLDGGSSAVVVNSRLLNRPTGGTTERAVASALIVGCKAL